MFSSVVFCSIISEGVFGRSFSPTSFPYTIYIHLLIIISHIWNSITSFFNHKIQSIGCNSPDISIYSPKCPQNILLPLSLLILPPSPRRRLVHLLPIKYTNFLRRYSPGFSPGHKLRSAADSHLHLPYKAILRLPFSLCSFGRPCTRKKGRTRWDPDLALPGTHLHFWAQHSAQTIKVPTIARSSSLLLYST